jgi:crossover junction endodeoxyribonuclease RuvC
MGIDPGIAITGYALLSKQGQLLEAKEYGVIRTGKELDPPQRLQIIYEKLNVLLDQYQPDYLVTERLFFSKNQTTAFGVGRTIGVVLLAASLRGLPWMEYSPPVVKQAVVGYGNAEKKQVQYMVQRILNLKEIPQPDDAADALAIAICHANHFMSL